MATPIRLLIAADSEIIRRAICTLLRSNRYSVCGEGHDYADLLKKLSVSTPDVVLMDMRMPNEGRYDPAVIKRNLKGSCLLAMSVWDDEETTCLAESYGAVKLLDKSQLASTLMPAIEDCMKQRKAHPTTVPSSITRK